MAGKNFIKQYCINDGKSFRLAHFDPDDTGGLKSKEEAQEALQDGISQWFTPTP